MTQPNGTTQIPGVMLYRHFYDALSSLDHEAVGQLTLALMEYAFFDVAPQLPAELQIAWTFMKNYADLDSQRYTLKVAHRRAAAEKRWAKTEQKSAKSPLAGASSQSLPCAKAAFDCVSPDSEPTYDGLRPYRDEKGVIRYK